MPIQTLDIASGSIVKTTGGARHQRAQKEGHHAQLGGHAVGGHRGADSY